MTTAEPPPHPLRVALVGAGPRGTSVLERIAANLPELAPDRPLEVYAIDPHPPGGGRIWRRDQSPWLWMNTTANDCTMFTDTTVTCTGPVVPGPTLTQWAGQLVSGDLPLPPGFAVDAVDLAEARRVHPGWFATRRLQNRYLSWVFQHVAERTDQLAVRALPARAVDLLDLADGRRRLILDSGFGHLDADVVVLTQGNTETRLTDDEERLARHAVRHDLVYVPTASTADLSLDCLRPGQRVVVRGLGLAFVDTVVLLTSGRGGSFHREADGTLRYAPSGREPLLYAGSRRGVPYHSKIHYDPPGGRPALPFHLTPEALDRGEPLDLREDVWPLVVRELTRAHYRELALSHPERLKLGADTFLARLDRLDWSGPGLKELVAEAVRHEADVFDVERIDRPLAALHFADHEALARWLDSYMEADLERRRDPSHSPDLAVFFALLSVFTVLTEAIGRGRISDASLARGMADFKGFFSFLASGPPGPRLEEILALTRAGVLRFTGANTVVEPVEGGFLALSDSTAATVRAEALVEARLPDPSLDRTTDPLNLSLLARGRIRGRPGSALIDADGEQRVVDARGRPHRTLFAVGPLVSGGVGSGGFSRPRTNAGFFRQNDALARRVLEDLGER